MNFNGELWWEWGFIPGSIIVAGDVDVKGRLFLSDGTAGAPSLAFNSEQTLGLYRSGAGAGTWVGGTFNAPVGLTAGPTTVSSLVSTGGGNFGTNSMVMGSTQIESNSGSASIASLPLFIRPASGTVTAGDYFGLGITRAQALTGPSTFLGVNKSTTSGQVPASYSYLSTFDTTQGMAIGRGIGGLPYYTDIKVGTDGSVYLTNATTVTTSISNSGTASFGGTTVSSLVCTGTSSFTGAMTVTSISSSGAGTYNFGTNSMTAGAISSSTLSASAQVMAKFGITGTQSIPNNSGTSITVWNTTPSFTQGAAITCDGTNFTFPVTGKYLTVLKVVWTTNGTGYRDSYVVHSGDAVRYCERQGASNSTSQERTTTSDVMPVSGADTALVSLTQTSGGALNILTETTITFYRLP